MPVYPGALGDHNSVHQGLSFAIQTNNTVMTGISFREYMILYP